MIKKVKWTGEDEWTGHVENDHEDRRSRKWEREEEGGEYYKNGGEVCDNQWRNSWQRDLAKENCVETHTKKYISYFGANSQFFKL